MKILKKQAWNIFFCLVAEGYLLLMTSSAGGLTTRAALCGASLCAFVYIYLKKPLKSLPISRGMVKLVHFVCAMGLTLTMIRTESYVPTMGVFAVLPTNLFALAVYLLEPLVRQHKEQLPDPAPSES